MIYLIIYQNKKLLFLFMFVLLCIACQKDYIPTIKIKNIDTRTTYEGPIILSADNKYDDDDYAFLLNDEEINLHSDYIINDAGFYQLLAINKYNNTVTDSLVFVILDPERGDAEWGLKKWTPQMPEKIELTNEQTEVIYSKNISEGLKIPFIFMITNNNALSENYYTLKNSVNDDFNYVKRGSGSISILLKNNNNEINFIAGNKQINITNHFNNTWSGLPSVITNDYTIAANSRIHITRDITISSGIRLTISEGCTFKIDKGINIINNGHIEVYGTTENPVMFCCSDPDSYWGGFICQQTNNSMNLNYTIFTQSGFNNTGNYVYGHAKRQALFYLDNTGFNISNCYIVDNTGQIFFSQYSTLDINNVFVHKAKTGGQLNYSQVYINNCIFSDFPDDNTQYTDEDNDCLYINQCEATINYSVFMYAKDDGIDSGANSGGNVTVNHCHFENLFHEGLALSSADNANKHHNIKNCTFIRCGQGIELGYSSPNHTVIVDSCIVTENNIGIRYGDNYINEHEGSMLVKNTKSYNNYDKNIWNMCRENWSPEFNNLCFLNTCTSDYDSNYPDLSICR